MYKEKGSICSIHATLEFNFTSALLLWGCNAGAERISMAMQCQQVHATKLLLFICIFIC